MERIYSISDNIEIRAIKNQPRLSLNLNTMLPGDVVLTGSNTFISKAISRSTLGVYSHATLMCRPLWFVESTDSGLVQRPANIIKYEHRDDNIIAFEKIDESVTDIGVFRINGLDTSKFLEDIDEKLLGTLGREYPEMVKLSSAIPLTETPAAMLRGILSLWDILSGRVVYAPGMFCSELVAAIFSLMQISLFDHPKPPNTVSPNDLARSKMQFVSEAFIETDPNIPNEDECLVAFRNDSGLLIETSKKLVEYTRGFEKLKGEMQEELLCYHEDLSRIIRQFDLGSKIRRRNT